MVHGRPHICDPGTLPNWWEKALLLVGGGVLMLAPAVVTAVLGVRAWRSGNPEACRVTVVAAAVGAALAVVFVAVLLSQAPTAGRHPADTEASCRRRPQRHGGPRSPDSLCRPVMRQRGHPRTTA
jgi:hypothetical protein